MARKRLVQRGVEGGAVLPERAMVDDLVATPAPAAFASPPALATLLTTTTISAG